MLRRIDALCETIFFAREITDAAARRPVATLLLDLDDPSVRPLTQLPPTHEDFLRAKNYGEGAREHFLARRAVLRRFLALRLGCAAEAVVVAPDKAGAPQLLAPKQALGSALYLSISGRGALAAFAIAPRPIGVDIEILSRPEEVPFAMLHKAEAERLRLLDSEARHKAFLQIWTVKEAYLKALRIGLGREPDEIEVRFEAANNIRLFDRGQPVATRACESRNGAFGSETIIAAWVVM